MCLQCYSFILIGFLISVPLGRGLSVWWWHLPHSTACNPISIYERVLIKRKKHQILIHKHSNFNFPFSSDKYPLRCIPYIPECFKCIATCQFLFGIQLGSSESWPKPSIILKRLLNYGNDLSTRSTKIWGIKMHLYCNQYFLCYIVKFGMFKK